VRKYLAMFFNTEVLLNVLSVFFLPSRTGFPVFFHTVFYY
jgi:hypothetical protein